ncbi:MAG: hypothetical protein ACLFPM_06185, partial [Candidatus Izemoplasmatales bacterium]
ADGLLGKVGDLQTHNMYAYCANNPVMYLDPSGEFFILSTILITTAIGGLLGFGFTFANELISNDFDLNKIDWKEIWGNTITGAAIGAAYGLGAGAGAIIKGTATLFSLTTTQSFVVLASTAGLLNFSAGALSYHIRHKGREGYEIGQMISSAFGQMGKGYTVFGAGTLFGVTGLWKPTDFGNMTARVLGKQIITFAPVYLFDNLYKY